MAAMGWLKHTTRAMLSAGGSLTKKHGLIVTSEKVGDKRKYSIKRLNQFEDRFFPPPGLTWRLFSCVPSMFDSLEVKVLLTT